MTTIGLEVVQYVGITLQGKRRLGMQKAAVLLLTSLITPTVVIATACTPIGTGNGGDQASCPRGSEISEPTVSYANDVVPLLSRSGCLSTGCHGDIFPSSMFTLWTYENSFVPGDEASALELCPIVPGDPDSSYMLEKLRPAPRSGVRMPVIGPPLSDEEIELIATWIREGAANN